MRADHIHPSIPQTLTPENLAAWLNEQADDQIVHEEHIDLDEDKKSEFEHKSSLASRAIDKLEDVVKEFKDYIKEGTPDPEEPHTITIPPTKGMKILKASRKFADEQIEQGYEINNVDIYFIPWPEERRMLALDSTGHEWGELSRDMDPDQEKKYGILFAKDKVKKRNTKVEEESPDQPELNI